MTDDAQRSSSAPVLSAIEEGGLTKTSSAKVRGRAAKKTAAKKKTSKQEPPVEAQNDTTVDEAASPPEAAAESEPEPTDIPESPSPEAAAESEPEPTDVPESPPPAAEVEPEPEDVPESVVEKPEEEKGDAGEQPQPEARTVHDVVDAAVNAAAARSTGLTPRSARRERRKAAKRDPTVSRSAVPPSPPPAPSPLQPPVPEATSAEPRVYTAQDAEPAMDDPMQRDGVTVGLIEPAEGESFPDVSGRRGPPANLTDICNDYKIGADAGACYVRVERLKPMEFQGRHFGGCIGYLRYKLTEGEFRDLCGGGTYELIVYGPDPRGKLDDTGQVKVKALTKGIKLSYPGNPFWVNLDEEQGPLDRRGANVQRGWSPSQDQQYNRGGSRMPATTADASMHRDNLSSVRELHRDERDERQSLSKQLEQERVRNRTSPDASQHLIDAVSQAGRIGLEATQRASDSQSQLLQAQLQRQELELKELRDDRRLANDKPSVETSAMDAFVKLTAATQPGKHSSDEIQRMHTAHRDETTRITQDHTRIMEEMNRRFADQLRQKDDELERERRRTADATKDARDEAAARERIVREEMDRNVKAVEERFKWQINEQASAHKRELESQQRNDTLLRDTNKVSHDTRLEALNDRVKAANDEADRAREDAEKKSDFGGQMEEFEARANLMGYQKDGGVTPPSTWQERGAAAIGNAIENADKIFESAAKTFRARGDAAQQQHNAMQAAQAMQFQAPPRQLAPQQAPHQRRVIRGANGQPRDVQRVWAQEDGPPIVQPHLTDVNQAAGMPETIPQPGSGTLTRSQRLTAQDEADAAKAAAQAPAPNPEPQQPPQAAPVPMQQPPQQVPMQQPLQQVPVQQPPQQVPVQQAAPAVAQQAPAPQHAPAPPDGQAQIDAQSIEQFREVLEGQYGQGMSAAAFAQGLYNEVGKMQMGVMLAQASADTVIESMSSNPKAAGSPLLSRDGMKWLRDAWHIGQQLVNQAN